MRFVSTRDKNNIKSFTQAVIQGLAKDGGLFVPENIEQTKFNFERQKELSFIEIAKELTEFFTGDELEDINGIVNQAFDFEPVIVELNENTFVLELFHGPSLAFKDFGARFLAEIVQRIAKGKGIHFTVLVATSGDTGAAVAKSFYEKELINVLLLYPSGRITDLQRKQITTLGGNIFTLEIKGDFDDCQRLVKQAFLDNELRSSLNLISANSINIGRLIPQTYYYYYALSKLDYKKAIMVVPSGNLGNLTAGLIAKGLGLKVNHFVAALNANKAFKEYLESGKIKSKKVQPTISNAMDVIKPSNLERIKYLFNYNLDEMKKEITALSVTEKETLTIIKETFNSTNYVLDPHGATALAAWGRLNLKNEIGVILETAHPAKFIDLYEPQIANAIEIPGVLRDLKNKKERKIIIENNYKIFKKEAEKLLFK